MGDFSTVRVRPGQTLLLEAAWGQSFQTKDLPDHETEVACIDGEIMADGTFVRSDGRWNPELNGWVELCARSRNDDCYVRFEAGRAVECRTDEAPNASMAWDSPKVWKPFVIIENT